MIEGQPQHGAAAGALRREFSGLVIEGQPQQLRHMQLFQDKFSGLVIEGQPQPNATSAPRCA